MKKNKQVSLGKGGLRLSFFLFIFRASLLWVASFKKTKFANSLCFFVKFFRVAKMSQIVAKMSQSNVFIA
tara:strand:+ start:182 stop:391 length:210 start_codon:yes stop_codon:yes gene_type:complete